MNTFEKSEPSAVTTTCSPTFGTGQTPLFALRPILETTTAVSDPNRAGILTLISPVVELAEETIARYTPTGGLCILLLLLVDIGKLS